MEDGLERGTSTLTLHVKFPDKKPLDPTIIVKGLVDKLAELDDDLMFLKGERILLSFELGDGRYLGECAGVSGVVHRAEVKWPDEDKIARRASRLSKRASAVSDDSKSKRLSKASSSTPRKKSAEDPESPPRRKHRHHKDDESPGEQTEKIGEGENHLKKHRSSKRRSKIGKQLSLEVDADVEMNPTTGSPMASIQESAEPKTPIAPTPVEEKPSQPVPAPVILSRYPLTLENTDEFGFDKSSSPSETHSISTTWDKETYRRREGKWATMTQNLDSWKLLLKKSSALIEERCVKGIPQSIRGRAWTYLSGANEAKAKAGLRDFSSFYKPDRLDIIEVIERDIDRTYPDHIMFREVGNTGQKELSMLLKSYSFYNPEIGYCQGMGMVAGMIMMQAPTDDAFWMMVTLLEQPKYLKDFYDHALSGVTYNATLFTKALQKIYPQVYAHLDKHYVLPINFVVKWFMTVFTTILPWASVLRVWDVFLFQGVFFLHKVGLAIIEIHQEKILKSADMQELLEFLLNIPRETLFPELLFKAIDRVKFKPKDLEKLVQEIESEKAGPSSPKKKT